MTGLPAFLQHLGQSCADDSFVRLVLSSPTEADAPVQRILGRLVELRGVRHLSFTLREARRDTTQNVPLPEAFGWVERKLHGRFAAALLATTQGDFQLQLQGDQARLIRHRARSAAPPPRDHDDHKPTLLGDTARPWLRGLGIVDADGKPRPKLADKHAQLDRYVEILAHLARDCGWHAAPSDAPALQFVDVGCGKGHLTFAAWHLAKHVLQRRAQVLGVEARADLVANANRLADEVAAGELRFAPGDIATAPLPQFDALIALHACNTATDHAIRRGLEAQAQLIVVAPCCHQEVRPQLGSPEPLAAVLRHGLMAERMAEWATDGLRALVLEWAGYRTKVIEFVSGEHTAKNLMLAAVRSAEPPSEAQRARARGAIDAFRGFFAIERHALDAVLATG